MRGSGTQLEHSRRNFLAAAWVAGALNADPGGRRRQGTAPDRQRGTASAHLTRRSHLRRSRLSAAKKACRLATARMGTLVWTTPRQIRFQINRADVYANNSY